jgi:hypothetical protein
MLGSETQSDNGGQINALGGDPVSELLDRVRGKVGGGNGSGNGDGGGGGGGGGGDDDPLANKPVNARMLIDALRMMADFTKSAIIMATDKQTDFTAHVADLSKQTAELVSSNVLEALKAEAEARQRLTPILVKRFEAIEHNLKMIEHHLGAVYESKARADDTDAGGGP